MPQKIQTEIVFIGRSIVAIEKKELVKFSFKRIKLKKITLL